MLHFGTKWSRRGGSETESQMRFQILGLFLSLPPCVYCLWLNTKILTLSKWYLEKSYDAHVFVVVFDCYYACKNDCMTLHKVYLCKYLYLFACISSISPCVKNTAPKFCHGVCVNLASNFAISASICTEIL